MAYYFKTTLKNTSLEAAREKVEAALKTEGFGILTEINVQATFKKKLDVDFRPYMILGACNPQFAHKAISAEENIGVFLPCNVVLQEKDAGEIIITAVDPVASMQAVGNENLGDLAEEVKAMLERAIKAIN